MDPSCFQSLIFTWRPCHCYLEACQWYSDFQQEHLKPKAKCFLLYYPNTAVWVMSWNFFPLTQRVFYNISCHGYHAFLSLGRIYPRNMCLNIFSFPLFCLIWWSYFPSIGLLNLFYDLCDISSNNPLLVQTPRGTTLSVRPCYYCWWYSGNHRWTITVPIGPPRFDEQENGSLCPSPLVPMLLLT